MAVKRDQQATIRSAVETHATRLRSLADEIERQADAAGLFSRGAVPLMRGWSAALRTVADELVEAASDPNGAHSVRRLARFGLGLLVAVTYFAPAANSVASDGLKTLLFDEGVTRPLEEASQSAEVVASCLSGDVGQPLDVGRQQSATGWVADVLRQLNDGELAERVLELSQFSSEADVPFAELDSVDESAELDSAEYVIRFSSGDGDRTVDFRVTLGPDEAGALVAPYEVVAVANSWLDGEVDKHLAAVYEDQQVQRLIDQRRGK